MKSSVEIKEDAKRAKRAIAHNTKLHNDYELYRIEAVIETELKKQAQKKEDKKAVNKRRKGLKDRLTMLMSNFLKPFENKYIIAYTQYQMSPIIDLAAMYPTANTLADFLEQTSTITYKEVNGVVTPNKRKGETEQSLIPKVSKENMFYKITKARKLIAVKKLTEFSFMKEAVEGYNVKFEKLIDKMVCYGFSTVHFRVEEISNSGNELAFLVKNDERTIHARAIFVEGVVVAPHYRFITTERKN